MAWVRNQEVVCTELEDGAVLLNLETRLYYSLNDVGLEIWRLVDGAEGGPDIGQRLTGRVEVEPERAKETASRFLEELERERLVVPGDPAPSPAPPLGDGSAQRRPFAQPVLVKHDEPLHEVATSPFDPQLPLAE
jgi:hypothetical protein